MAYRARSPWIALLLVGACSAHPARSPAPPAPRASPLAANAQDTEEPQKEPKDPGEVLVEALRARLLETESREGPDSINALGYVIGLADAEAQRGALKEAEPLLRRAIAGAEKGNAFMRIAGDALHEKLGLVLMARAKYDEAEKELRIALAALEKLGGELNPRAARTTAYLSTLYQNSEQFEAGERLLTSTIDRWRKAYGEGHGQVGMLRNELAMTYFARGDLERAEVLLRQALAALEAVEIKQPRFALQLIAVIASLDRNLGHVLERKGNIKGAEERYRTSHQLSIDFLGDANTSTAHAKAQLGRFLGSHGKVEEGTGLLRQAVSTYESSVPLNYPLLLAALLQLGNVLLRGADDAAGAVAVFQQAAAIAEKRQSSISGSVLSNLAWSLERDRRSAEAEATHLRALATARQRYGDFHAETRGVLAGLLRFYMGSQRVDDALRAAKELGEANEDTVLRALLLGSERQRRAYIEHSAIQQELETALTLHLKQAPANQAAAALAFTTLLRRKGRALEASADGLRRLRRHLSPNDSQTLAELQTKRTAAAALAFRGPLREQSRSDFEEALAALTAEADALEERLGGTRGNLRTLKPSITWESIQKAVPHGGTLIELVSYHPISLGSEHRNAKRLPEYAAYTLRASGQPMATTLGEAKQIETLATRMRSRLASRRPDWVEPARRLYDLLILPIRDHLGEGNALFVAPDGALNLVPFGLLLDKDGRFLMERHDVTYLSSGRDLLDVTPNPSATRSPPLILAAPDFDASSPNPESKPNAAAHALLGKIRFGPLPGTLREARLIASTLKGATLLSGRAANETALREAKGPDVLHIATHGFFLEPKSSTGNGARGLEIVDQLDVERAEPRILPVDPLLRAGIALSGANRRTGGSGDDGIVTALELASIDLDDTELVTLSACDTAVGEVKNGEGVFGMRRALVIAGAKTQLLSLWPVADDATQDLMARYYKRVDAGRGRGEALRDVQLEVMHSRGRSHPYYWGGFLVSGASGPLESATVASP